jgi:hypothetical protein
MPLLLIGLLALGGLAWWEMSKSSTSDVGPSGGPTGNVVPTSIDSSGAMLVTLAPGNMGQLQMVSQLTAMTSMSTAPSLDVQAPTGVLQSMTSSNTNVMFPQSIPAGSTTSGVAMGPALAQGSTQLSFSWIDGSGNPQTSSFTVVGT